MDLGLRNRAYVITGASRGLGRATAEALVADGARVVVSGRSAERVRHTVAALGPDHALGVAADNADPDTPVRLVDAALERWNRLDGGLISVGGPPAGGALEPSDELWRTSFETIVLGSIRLARAITRGCATSSPTDRSATTGPTGQADRTDPTGPTDQADRSETPAANGDRGSIAFVLSTSVRAPLPGFGISNVLRPGLAGLAKDLADELGPQGVRVNGLLPGTIDTDRIRELADASGDPDAYRRTAGAKSPLGRIGQPAEFARVAAFVLSPAASFVDGAMIPVDGGALRAI